MFHYFRRKEDILAELLDRTVEPTLEYARLLAAGRARPEVKLDALVVTDVRLICSGPFNLTGLYFLPEVRAQRFRSFWTKRQQLFDYYRSLIRSGCASRTLVAPSVDLAAELAFGTVESVAIWFDRNAHSADAIAKVVASSILRSLLRDVGDLEIVSSAGESLRRRIGQPVPPVNA
jgi:AcrR family transcriptional regulator